MGCKHRRRRADRARASHQDDHGPDDREPDAGDAGLASPNPHKLYRDPEAGMVAGVCAGVAEYFDISRKKVRIGAVLALIFFPPQTAIVYGLAWVLLRAKPAEPLYRDRQEEAFWRQTTGRPEDTLGALRQRFRKLDGRLQGLERHLTSEEYQLRRDIEAL